jgi:hypothetical protein
MTEFYEFKTPKFRKTFFNSIKENSKLKWKEILEKEKFKRATLDFYKKGGRINKEKFKKLASYVSSEKQKEIYKTVNKIEAKTWLSRGGKKAYKKNMKEFKKGREIGLIKIKEKRLKENKEIKIKSKKIKITKEICEFIGAFIGDGFFNCYNNKLYQIEFAGDSRYDLSYYKNHIIPIVQSLVNGINPHIYFLKNKNAIRVVFYSKKLFIILKEKFGFTPGKKTHTVKIPEFIINSNKQLINSTIRGLFNTDGGLFLDKRKSYKRPYPRIIFTTVSKPLYLQLKRYLNRNFKLYTREDKSRKSYSIDIYGFNQLKKWQTLIGFSNPRHLNKMPL